MPKGFATNAAGTDIGVLTPISEFESQTIQPVAAVSHTNSNWTPGQSITFRWQSSATRWFVPHNSRLKIRLTVKQGVGAVPPSVRLSANAVSQLFSSVRYQLNNKTLEHRSSDYGLYANFMTRSSIGKSASKTAGDASLYSFDRRMTPVSAPDDLDILASGAALAPTHYADQNHKQMILQKVGVNEFELSEIVHLDVWQGEQFWPGGSHELELLISQNWDKDFLVSEQVQHTAAYARAGGGHDELGATTHHQFRGGHPEVYDGGTTVHVVPTISIKSVEWEAFYATPLVSPMRVPSMQVKYRVSHFHERKLAGSTFNESFQVQPGVTGICAFCRIKASNINMRTEQFAAAGAGVANGTYGYKLTAANEQGVLLGTGGVSKGASLAKAISSFSAELGGKVVPKQAFSGIDFQKYQCSRVYSAYLNYMDNAGAQKEDMMSLQEFVDSPLIFLHVLLPPREAATTLRLSGTLLGALGANTQQYLSCFTFSNSVVELLYESSSDEPTRIRGPEAIV